MTATFRHTDDAGVATFRVQTAQFRRQVPAHGTVSAVTAHPTTTPHQANRALKTAWIQTDGAVVKQGDGVVRFDPTEFENELLDATEERATAANRHTKTTTDSSTTKTNLRRDANQAESELEA